MRISVFAEKCTGCRICELICSHTKLKVFNPKTACIKVIDLDYWGFSNPVLCIQCKKPRCVEVCPTQALTQEETGVIHLDATRCNGCGDCVTECPVGAINLSQERNLPMICDLCDGKPACVEWCPAGALVFNTETKKRTKGRGKKELGQSIRKGKRSLAGLNLPETVPQWYDRFV